MGIALWAQSLNLKPNSLREHKRKGLEMKSYTYKVVWTSFGCVVFRSDGATLSFNGRRYSHEDCNRIGSKLPAMPGAMSKCFRK